MSDPLRPHQPIEDSAPVWLAEEAWVGKTGKSETPTTEIATIDLWRIDLRESARGAAEDVSRLTSSERHRASSLRIKSKRRQFVRTRSQLRRLLALYLETEIHEIAIETQEHGKLVVPGGPAFNVSHSGHLAVIAIATSWEAVATRVGIDIERQRSGRPLDRMAERFFAREEADAYGALEAGVREADFYRRWALKEAYLKALGTGLTHSSRGFVVADDPVSWRARPLVRSCTRHPDTVEHWLFRNGWVHFPQEQGADRPENEHRDAPRADRYALALCASGPGSDAELRFFQAS